MATKKKAAPTKKAKPKSTPKKPKTKALLNETPVSVRVYHEQRARLKQVALSQKVPMGKIMRELTFKYLPIEYPTKAA